MRQSLIVGHLALSDRHLAEAEERISLQRLRVANSIGIENARAKSVLRTYTEILEQLRIHRAILVDELRLSQVPE